MSDERATISVGDLMWLYDLPDDPAELSIDQVVDLKAMRERIDSDDSPELARLIGGIYRPAISILDARLAAPGTHERLAVAPRDIAPASSFWSDLRGVGETPDHSGATP